MFRNLSSSRQGCCFITAGTFQTSTNEQNCFKTVIDCGNSATECMETWGTVTVFLILGQFSMSRWARSGVRRYDQTIKSFDWRIGREEYRRSLFSDQSEHCWCCGRCYITSEQWIQVTVHCSVISIQCPYWVLSEAAAPSLEKPQQPQDGVLLVLLLLRWQGQGGDRAERLRVRPLHRAGDHARIPGQYCTGYWLEFWMQCNGSNNQCGVGAFLFPSY